MRRSLPVAMALLAPALLHVSLHRFHGPSTDYDALAIAAAASWIGLPGPGEPVLIAAGILAAKHKLDLTEVLLVAWVAATVGGILGWAIGLKAGRAVVTVPGPLHGLRLRALARGEEIFARHPVVGIVLTPSWVAGISRVRSRVYQPINALTALLWAVGIGVGAYLLGPPVLDMLNDAGTVATVMVIAVIVVAVGVTLIRRRRRRRATGLPGPLDDAG